MKILFSIPIYAFSEDVLSQQYEKQLQKFLQSAKYNLENEQFNIDRFQKIHRNQLVYRNYIIGFIDIQYDKGDIIFRKYLMTQTKSGYTLKDNKEIFDKMHEEELSEYEKEKLLAQYTGERTVLYKMRYGTEKKHYMKCEYISEPRICNLTNKSNEEILEEIEYELDATLNDIRSSYGKSIYFDLNNYNSIKKYVDFGLIVNDD